MDSDSDDDALDDVTCWVCFGVFDTPCTLACSHSFCRRCCEALLVRAALCPFCRAPFGAPLPGPSAALSARLAALRAPEPAPPTPGAPAAALRLHRDEWLVILRQCVRADGDRVRVLCRAARVCAQLRRVADDGALWREQCVRDFPFVAARPDADGPLAWKRAYARAVRSERGWRAGTVRDWTLVSLRSAGEPAPVTALLCVGLAERYSAAGGQLTRWGDTAEMWRAALPGDISALLAADSGVWAVCAATLLHYDSSGTPRASLALPAPHRCYAALGATVAAATATHLHVLRGGVAHAVATPAPVLALAGVAEGWLAVDSGHVSCHGALPPHSPLWRVAAPPGHVLTGAALLAHRTLAVYTHTHCVMLLDTAARVWGPPSPNLGSAVRDVLADDGRVLVAMHDNRALVFASVPRDGAAWPAVQHTLRCDVAVHAWQLSGRRAVAACADNAVRVFDCAEGRLLYALLGGSLAPRDDNPAHPTRPGCAFVQLQPAGVTAALNAVVKTWSIKDQ